MLSLEVINFLKNSINAPFNSLGERGLLIILMKKIFTLRIQNHNKSNYFTELDDFGKSLFFSIVLNFKVPQLETVLLLNSRHP